MVNSLEQLAQSIFKKPLDDCREEELLNFTQRYPYFGPGQFLYLKKLDPNSEVYLKQYQKAVLFFHDPALFDQYIHPEAYQSEFVVTVFKEEAKANIAEPTTPSKTLTESKSSTVSTTSQAPLPAATESVITFEPFHTVDYFASQGIKLSLEDVSKDKFGKQLKSFTEWLKTMKKVPPAQPNQVQGKAEKQVQNLAAHSVQSSDIVTEAMAQVWLHQGNKAKAIEIYRKLSLLNPSKSSYFATKIELLNDSN